MMNAIPVLNDKKAFGAGFVQLVVWQVREPVPASAHRFKYRLVYFVDGERVVGYDNERAKAIINIFGAKNILIYSGIFPACLMIFGKM